MSDPKERYRASEYRLSFNGIGGRVHLSRPFATLDELLAVLERIEAARLRSGQPRYTHIVTFVEI